MPGGEGAFFTGRLFIGLAGWSIRKDQAHRFPPEGTHLERYAARFPAVEINSSFYRSHQRKTYERWAASVPKSFRFAVKLPRQVTHYSRLKDTAALERFLEEVAGLGEKLGPLLMQLPPGLPFQEDVVGVFLEALRERFEGVVVCEPRHASWFTPEAEGVLEDFRVARVAADPAPHPGADRPGAWRGCRYFRLHGSPRMYYSAYSEDFLQSLAEQLREAAHSSPVWCIFNNTAAGAATENAFRLMEILEW
ncbi:MAG: DUF72 domain-containing protein [Calditrichaeota bacterium]|nr:MAG: DUF72 domain-containing protein [Calditrichota bacterium]